MAVGDDAGLAPSPAGSAALDAPMAMSTAGIESTFTIFTFAAVLMERPNIWQGGDRSQQFEGKSKNIHAVATRDKLKRCEIFSKNIHAYCLVHT